MLQASAIGSISQQLAAHLPAAWAAAASLSTVRKAPPLVAAACAVPPVLPCPPSRPLPPHAAEMGVQCGGAGAGRPAPLCEQCALGGGYSRLPARSLVSLLAAGRACCLPPSCCLPTFPSPR